MDLERLVVIPNRTLQRPSGPIPRTGAQRHPWTHPRAGPGRRRARVRVAARVSVPVSLRLCLLQSREGAPDLGRVGAAALAVTVHSGWPGAA